jgi:hypothetical protein
MSHSEEVEENAELEVSDWRSKVKQKEQTAYEKLQEMIGADDIEFLKLAETLFGSMAAKKNMLDKIDKIDEMLGGAQFSFWYMFASALNDDELALISQSTSGRVKFLEDKKKGLDEQKYGPEGEQTPEPEEEP